MRASGIIGLLLALVGAVHGQDKNEAAPPAAGVLVLEPPANAESFFGDRNEEAGRRKIANHIVLMLHPDTLEKMLTVQKNQFDVPPLREMEAPADRVRWLQEHVKVVSPAGTTLMMVQVDHPDRRTRALIARALGDAYMDLQHEATSSRLRELAAFKNNQKVKIQARLRDVVDERKKVTVQHILDGGGDQNRPAARELELIEQIRIKAQAQVELDLRTQRLEEIRKGGEAIGAVPADVGLDELSRSLAALEVRLELARQSSGPDAPEVKALAGQAAGLERLIQKRRAANQAAAHALAMEKATHQRDEAAMALEAATRRVENLRADWAELASSNARIRVLNDELAQLRDEAAQLSREIERIVTLPALTQLSEVRWAAAPTF